MFIWRCSFPVKYTFPTRKIKISFFNFLKVLQSDPIKNFKMWIFIPWKVLHDNVAQAYILTITSSQSLFVRKIRYSRYYFYFNHPFCCFCSALQLSTFILSSCDREIYTHSLRTILDIPHSLSWVVHSLLITFFSNQVSILLYKKTDVLIFCWCGEIWSDRLLWTNWSSFGDGNLDFRNYFKTSKLTVRWFTWMQPWLEN